MTGHGDRAPLLTPGLRTFLAVDVVLVLTFLVLAVVVLAGREAGPGPSEPTTPVASATDSPPAEENPEAEAPASPEPEAVVALERFLMPSGNIWCTMTATSASCTIFQFSFTPPVAPGDCTGSVGNVITVTADSGAFLPCVTAVAQPPEATAVLQYGQASTIGQMTCFSSENGATCRNDSTGAGFSVARAGYTLL